MLVLPGPAGEASMPASNGPTGHQLIRAQVGRMPKGPGVYRMTDAKGDVIYVGKAKSLRRRLASYAKLSGHTIRIMRMIEQIHALEVVTTGSETEALLLEANLIKRFKPRYNVILRDDKSFPYILLTGDHAFPQVLKHRNARTRKGDYYGPFASAGAVGRTLNALQKIFLLRSCSDSVFSNRTRPCLLHQIKRCSAPCVGLISEDAYGALVAEAKAFLDGRSRAVQETLTKQMEEASAALEFEKAAAARDRIRALTHIQSHQDINAETVGDADIIALDRQGGVTCVQVFFFRNGQNWGTRAYFPRHDKSDGPPEIMAAFIAQFYDDKPAPKQLILSETPDQQDLLEEALSLRAGRKVQLLVPQRGEKRDLIEHALQNAKDALGRRLSETETQMGLLRGLGELLELDEPPLRIEVYDNSHVMGTNAVGGMIVAGGNGFEKGQYRKFNIKWDSTTPGDDFAMMREVLTRRFSRLAKDEAEGKTTERPGLVIIDGGKGQLDAALAVLNELGLADIPLLSIAKGPDRNAGRERFFVPGREPFMLEAGSPVLYFLQRLRDEAHRFAIGTHRAKRAKAMEKNPLDEIQGVGPTRKRALLLHFGSARAVERANLDDLEKVVGISKATARLIYDHFHGDD